MTRSRRPPLSRCSSQRVDERLESVSKALALSYQSLMHLGTAIHEQSFEDFDAEAISALTFIVEHARNDARVVAEALPAPINVLELDDDYQGPNLGGEPLQPLLDEYQRRAGDHALAAAMDGMAGPPRAHRQASRGRRRTRKGTAK